jgi:hypothetical protein
MIVGKRPIATAKQAKIDIAEIILSSPIGTSF